MQGQKMEPGRMAYIVGAIILFLVIWIGQARAEWPPTNLPDRMMTPENATWGQFDLRPDLSIRYVSMNPDGPVHGIITVVHGVTSAPEFDHELHRHFLAQGLQVWALDMPGHGLSTRWLENRHKVFVDNFATYTSALHYLRQNIIQPADNLPIYLMGTSMGGHIVLRHAGEYPDDFDAVVSQVPMLDIVTGDLPKWLVRGLAWLGDSFGMSESYIPGDGDWKIPEPYALENSCCTTDPVRDRIGTYWRLQKPDLQMAGLTYRWLNKAYESMDMINEAVFLEKVKAPVLMISAGRDTLVDSASHPPACALITDCQLVEFPSSKHVPTLEVDSIRDRALAVIDGFIAGN